IRSGVPSSPSRCGSSPAHRIKVRTASSASSRVGRRTATGCRERCTGAKTGGAATCDINFSLAVSRCAGGLLPPSRSVEPDRLMRAVEREGWNLDPEAVAARSLHLIAADHDAGRGRQRSAAGVLEAFAGAEDRLLTDNAGAAHFLHPSVAVGDLPMAVAKLDRFLASIFDADMVGPYVTVFGR